MYTTLHHPHSRPADSGQASGDADARRPSRLLRYAFYAFVFSIPYEMGSAEGNLQLPTLALAGLLAISMLHPKTCLRWPPSAFWWFACWVMVWIISGVLYSAEHASRTTYHTIVLMEMLGLFWVSFNLMRDEETAKNALITLAISCGVLALLQLAGVTATTADVGKKVERLSAMGQNPNHTAMILSIGMLTFLALPGHRLLRSVAARVVVIGMLLAMTVVFMQTGSRGGLAALAIGLVFVAASAPDLRGRVRNIATVLVAFVGLAWFTYTTDTVRERMERTLESGSLSKREQIYPLALQMIAERPVLGWGPTTSVHELGSRLSQEGKQTRDTHNVILFVLTSTGFVGLIPIVIGVAFCIAGAWKGRRGPHQALPFALIMLIIAANMHTPCLFKKGHWFVLAYGVASGVAVADLRRKKRMEAALAGADYVVASRRVRRQPNMAHVAEQGEPRLDRRPLPAGGETL